MKKTSQHQNLLFHNKWDDNPKTERVICTKRMFNGLVGEVIRKKRESLNIRGVEFARLLAVSQQQISRYELGETTISLYQLDRVLSLLSISWSSFISEIVQLGVFTAPVEPDEQVKYNDNYIELYTPKKRRRKS